MIPETVNEIDAVAAMGHDGVADAPSDASLPLTDVVLCRGAEDLHHALAFCSMSQVPVTREDMIRKEAYLHAEARSFAPDGAVEDWLCAEREVDHWLGIYGLPHHFTMKGLDQTSV